MTCRHCGMPCAGPRRLSPNTEARLVKPGTGEEVTPGHLGDPEATAATITGGWPHTGDLVRVDENELFWIVDRLKELIEYKGYQVAPAELESVLPTHSAVLDAAVIGVVAPYKKVRSVEFVTEIPKSPTGKIPRRLLN